MTRQPSPLGVHDGRRVRHLDQRELATRWGVSVRTLERWRWLNEGPGFLKLGARVTYRLEDIEAFEADHLRGGDR